MKTLAEAHRSFMRRYLTKLLIEANGSVRIAARLAGRERTDMYKIFARYGFHFIHRKGNWDVPLPP